MNSLDANLYPATIDKLEDAVSGNPLTILDDREMTQVLGAVYTSSANSSLSSLTAVAANFGPLTLATPSVSGLYRISYYLVCTATGSGDTPGQLVFNYQDETGPNALYASMPSASNATLLGNGEAPVWCVAGQPVTCTLGSATFATGSLFDYHFAFAKI